VMPRLHRVPRLAVWLTNPERPIAAC
jgi:hypothetical protein